MTFTEAATLVLRLVGKPLHFKEITDVAIEKNLLSHVGKNPEVTMGARLSAQVKKTEKDNPLVRIKPGVFALAEWDEKTIERGLSDLVEHRPGHRGDSDQLGRLRHGRLGSIAALLCFFDRVRFNRFFHRTSLEVDTINHAGGAPRRWVRPVPRHA